jgi:hypothetical protein
VAASLPPWLKRSPFIVHHPPAPRNYRAGNPS